MVDHEITAHFEVTADTIAAHQEAAAKAPIEINDPVAKMEDFRRRVGEKAIPRMAKAIEAVENCPDHYQNQAAVIFAALMAMESAFEEVKQEFTNESMREQSEPPLAIPSSGNPEVDTIIGLPMRDTPEVNPFQAPQADGVALASIEHPTVAAPANLPEDVSPASVEHVEVPAETLNPFQEAPKAE